MKNNYLLSLKKLTREIDEFCMYMDIKTVSLDHLDDPYLNIGIWENSDGKIRFTK